MKSNSDYKDIIDLPYKKSLVYPHMSMKDRAAQFSPFAALTGHKEAIDETARITDKKIELSDDEKIILDRQLTDILNNINKNITYRFTYFIQDSYKQGGAYVSNTGLIKKVDTQNGFIYLEDHKIINIADIIKIDIDSYT